MKCEFCSSDMLLDDKDTFNGVTTFYWICPTCDSSCNQAKIFNKVVSEEWFNDNE